MRRQASNEHIPRTTPRLDLAAVDSLTHSSELPSVLVDKVPQREKLILSFVLAFIKDQAPSPHHPRPRPNPRPNPRLAQRRALRSEDKADAFFRHVQNRHVLAAFEVGVHHCRRATTGALLQRDLDAQSREIDLFGKANQLHLGESESEGEAWGGGDGQG